MKRGQFSQEQITLLLRQAETGAQTISQICREYGITQTTFYRWRNKFGSMTTDEALAGIRQFRTHRGRPPCWKRGAARCADLL